MRTPFQWLKDEGLFGYNWRYLLTHPWIIIREIYYTTKWFVQRGRRGFSDRDNWSIDGYLSDWMPKALRNLKSEHGFPVQVYCEMFPNGDWTQMNEVHSALAHARWHENLEIMAQGFEARVKINDYEYKGADELTVLQDQLNEGLRLFSHFYLNLWD